MDIVTKITELKKLLDAGLLSQEEFDKKKSELLEAHIKGQENNEISKEANIPEKTTNEPDEKYPISLDKTKTNSDSSMVSVLQSNKVELNGGNLYSTKKFSKIIACCMLVQCLAGILSINRCSQSKDEDLTSEDSYANTIMEEEPADATATTPPVEEVPFVTPDLAIADVKGHVKSVKTEDGIFKFTKDGILTDCPSGVSSEFEMNISRDDDGFITEICYGTLGCDQYEFDKNNTRLSKITYEYMDCSETITFIYNDQGVVIKEDVKVVSYGNNVMEDEPETTYKSHIISIVEMDTHGNWVKRKYDNTIQTRSIEYYTDGNNSSAQKIVQEHVSESSQKEMDRYIHSDIVGRWKYVDTDYDPEEEFTYLEMLVSFNEDGSFSGYADHSGMYVNGSGYYTLARLNFSGKFTCEVHNVFLYVYADDNIRYSQGEFNKEMLPDSSKKEIFANLRNYIEKRFHGSGGLFYEDDDLDGFRKI